MKNREYWLKRAIIDDKLAEKDTNKIAKLLKKELIKTKREIKKELAYLYSDIDQNGEYSKYRLESVLSSINSLLDNLYHKEINLLNNSLIERYIHTYNEKVEQLGVNSSFNMLSESLVQEIVKTNWSGLTFSERIWENRRRLSFAIKSVLSNGLKRGESIQKMSRAISSKLNASIKDARRLVRTETCWIQTKATVDSYTKAGLTQYEFCAYLDSRTSDTCRSLDGKVFDIKDFMPGVNAPPMHANCRSCILPVTK
ncbi:phage head morphogenesis, SPP1 gp7 family domain protein [[Clostridium] bifermentans ATCC 638]|uniref:Phage head morphogenesis, SPP1 gp7 family domain protein n=1 Tax=Paraclostridium bifermentans ATCC 638 = DSM 14991 TaxID=1233171 RepID=T4VG70_PARBF|nr:minor capsid protein [Paraclostridium bifermentans]EQK39756.1 phage head morphogenesis, SPP1 gp7 family domain protein [[Clostridium] bifermentans ATCC 638] [Paraclostridium bifermentans ATCC 638 = DSM 14991]